MISKLISLIRSINFKDTSKTLAKCDVLFFSHDSDRGINLNNQAYSPILDSYREEFEKKKLKCVTIAHPWSTLISNKAYGNPIAINRSYLFALISQKFFNPEALVNFYERLFLTTSPTLIVTIGCENALCEAARNLNIHHQEILHGIGYTPIPWQWDTKATKHLPKEILSLDPVSTKTFGPLKEKGVIITEIPHPFLSRFKKNNIPNLPQEWLPISPKKKKEKVILITLQWGYDEHIDCVEKFKGILKNGVIYENLAEVIKNTSNYVFWRIRFHPVQYRNYKKYRAHFEFIEKLIEETGCCEWEESTNKPLPSILADCDGHITMLSMSSYEAAYMNVPTLALCPTLKSGRVHENFFQDLVEQGLFVKTDPDFDKILLWVKSLKQ